MHGSSQLQGDLPGGTPAEYADRFAHDFGEGLRVWWVTICGVGTRCNKRIKSPNPWT